MEPVKRVAGRMAPLDLADVDTDQIIPKQFLKRIERTGYGPFLFYDWRARGNFVLDRPEYSGASVLVAGANFGCGSSREHAPWALRDFGFRAIVAPSFADIFRANCYKTGLLAVTLPDSQVRHLIDLVSEDPTAEVTVDLEAQQVRGDGFSYRFEIDAFARECLLGGLDEIALVERHDHDIAAYEAALVHVDLVLVPPEEWVGGHGDEHVAAGAQHAPRLAEGGGVVVQVLDHVECRHEIEAGILERKRRRLTQPNVLEAALAAVSDRLRVDVDAFGLAERRQVAEHRARPAAHVEDSPWPSAVVSDISIEDLDQDSPPADEPPVDVLDLAVLAVVLAFQSRISDPKALVGSIRLYFATTSWIPSSNGIRAFQPSRPSMNEVSATKSPVSTIVWSTGHSTCLIVPRPAAWTITSAICRNDTPRPLPTLKIIPSEPGAMPAVSSASTTSSIWT